MVYRLKQLRSLRKLAVAHWRHHCVRRKDSLAWLEELRRQLPGVEVAETPPDELRDAKLIGG